MATPVLATHRYLFCRFFLRQSRMAVHRPLTLRWFQKKEYWFGQEKYWWSAPVVSPDGVRICKNVPAKYLLWPNAVVHLHVVVW